LTASGVTAQILARGQGTEALQLADELVGAGVEPPGQLDSHGDVEIAATFAGDESRQTVTA
jgi:hypothetical protein